MAHVVVLVSKGVSMTASPFKVNSNAVHEIPLVMLLILKTVDWLQHIYSAICTKDSIASKRQTNSAHNLSRRVKTIFTVNH